MSPVTFRSARDLPPMSRSADTMLWNRTGSWRFLRPRYQDKVAPCAEGCPAAEDIARVQILLGQGDFEAAWLRIREENPLPGVCGRVCHHPCEAACNRGEYDDPVSVNSLERFLADHAWKLGLPPPSPEPGVGGGRVAVVGAGPAGLAAAYFLRRLGHEVDLFDARAEPGGLLRYGIPEYRLPLDALAWEVGLILNDGVRFHGNRRLGTDLTWDELSGYDAVFLAVGTWRPAPLGAEGEEHARDGLALLEAIRRGETPEVSGKVAVIGGGNTAMDVARSLLRLGAEPVVYYRRRLQDMPALPEEIHEAREEGIPFQTLLAPKRIEPLPQGGFRLVLTTMEILEEDEGGRPRVVPSGHPDVEVDVDAVSDGEHVVIGGIMEHIEQAGVHSGDSACSLPPYSLRPAVLDEIRRQVMVMARELGVVGLMNTQFAIKGEDIYILEVNPRASRTAPFVSKACGVSLAKVGARCMTGRTLAEQGVTEERIPGYFSVKESVFPFIKFLGVDPILGPEMKSTGEVMGVGATFPEAFAKAQLAAGVVMPRGGKVFLSVRDAEKPKVARLGRDLVDLGFEILATAGTARALEKAGVPCVKVNKVGEGRPHIVDMIKNDDISFIVNTTEGKQAIADSYAIRREALQHKVTYTTTLTGALATCMALKQAEDYDVHCLQQLHGDLTI